MKVKADVTIEMDVSDLADMGEEVEGDLVQILHSEIRQAILRSDVFRELKMTVYHACLDSIREQIAKDFVDQIKGEDNG